MKKYVVFVCLCLCMSILCPQIALSGKEAVGVSNDISPALELLRSEIKLTKCGIIGSDIQFEAEDFDGVFGCEVEYITVTETPPTELGVLKLSGIELIKGQTIPRDSIKHLKLTPTGMNECNISFSISSRAVGWEHTEVECVMNMLTSINFAPVAEERSFETVKDISVSGRLAINDPDDDKITYTLEKYPQYGNVKLDTETGRILYTPKEGYLGSDSFICYATDEYGNRSSEVKVTVNTVRNKSKVVYSDMTDNDAHYAAIKMAEKNIMTYRLKDGKYYFEPEETVTRCDFAVMLLTALELDDDIKYVADSAFIDDTILSVGRKSYLSRALELGIVDNKDGYFQPLEPITKAEASVMIDRAMSLPTVGSIEVFSDKTDVPAGAVKSMAALYSMGIIEDTDGKISPNQALTKADSAVMLCRAMK